MIFVFATFIWSPIFLASTANFAVVSFMPIHDSWRRATSSAKSRSPNLLPSTHWILASGSTDRLMTQSITMPNSNGDNTQPLRVHRQFSLHTTLAVFIETSDDIDGFHRQTVLCRYIPQSISVNAKAFWSRFSPSQALVNNCVGR